MDLFDEMLEVANSLHGTMKRKVVRVAKLGKLYKELSELKTKKMRIMEEKISMPLTNYYNDIGFASQYISKKEGEIEVLENE